MKKTIKFLASLLLTLTLTLGLSFTALAAASTITFRGVDKGFDVAPGSKYTSTDLFDNFKDVMPGDELKESIEIINEARDCDYIRVYLRMVPHDAQGNPLTYDEVFENEDGKDQDDVDGERDETVTTMVDFLKQLTMRIYDGSELIYESTLDKTDELTSRKYVGKLERHESLDLRVELDVPIEMGNEYANRVGEVDWVILAECYKDDKLIHTGQLNWPIYVLSAVGILLLIAGVYLMTRKRKENYA